MFQQFQKFTFGYPGQVLIIPENTRPTAIKHEVAVAAAAASNYSSRNSNSGYCFKVYGVFLMCQILLLMMSVVGCRSEGSVRVDFNLEHTYYLDRSFPGHEALRRILVSELSRGKLGIYSASMDNFVFERIGPLAEGNGPHLNV